MPDDAEAAAAPGNTPPFKRFIAYVSLPQKFNTKGNPTANWKKWIQIWKAYEIVTGLDKQPSTLRLSRVSVLVLWKYECRFLSRVEGRGSRVKCRVSRVKCRGSRVKCRG